MRVVRKVLVLSYEGEDLLVLALTSAKVPRRGSRKFFFPRKFCVRVACKQEAGVMNHVYLPAARPECSTKVGRGMRGLRVAARTRRSKSNPQPAETSLWEF